MQISSLPISNLAPIAAYISFSGNLCTLIVPPDQPPALINNLPTRKQVLTNDMSFALGNLNLIFKEHEEPKNTNNNSNNFRSSGNGLSTLTGFF